MQVCLLTNTHAKDIIIHAAAKKTLSLDIHVWLDRINTVTNYVLKVNRKT